MLEELDANNAEVFICYKSEDKARVAVIRKALESQGVTVSQDVDMPGGQDWTEWASPAIHNCKVVLLMCTEISLKSRHIRDEVALSQKCDKPLIPLHLEKDLIYPSGGMDLRLGPLNIVWILDRPSPEWLPDVLKTLRLHKVRMRAWERLPEGLIPETVTWLEKLRAAFNRLSGFKVDTGEPSEETARIQQRAIPAAATLKRVNGDLP